MDREEIEVPGLNDSFESVHLFDEGGNTMEKCEHKELRELKQMGGPILMVCIKCNQILKVPYAKIK